MDISIISSLCKELLLSHDRVSLGDLGSFMAEVIPASITRDARSIAPPGRRITFKSTETWNDGLLDEAYATYASLSKEDAAAAIRDAFAEYTKRRGKEKKLELPDFGTITFTKDGTSFFSQNKDVELNPNGFGLDSISISPLDTPSKVQCALPGKPLEPITAPEEEITLDIEIPQEEASETTEEPETPQETETTQEPETPQETETPQAPVVPEEPEIAPNIEAPEEPEIPEEPVTPEEPTSYSDEDSEDYIDTTNFVDASELTGNVVLPEPENYDDEDDDEEILFPEYETSEEEYILPPPKRWPYVVLGILFVVVALIFLAFIFRNSLAPFWEKILYSASERALLHPNGV